MSDPLLPFIRTVGDAVPPLIKAAEIVNLQVPIPWRQREGVRAIEGHLEKVDDLLYELAAQIDGPEAGALIADLWDV